MYFDPQIMASEERIPLKTRNHVHFQRLRVADRSYPNLPLAGTRSLAAIKLIFRPHTRLPESQCSVKEIQQLNRTMGKPSFPLEVEISFSFPDILQSIGSLQDEISS